MTIGERVDSILTLSLSQLITGMISTSKGQQTNTIVDIGPSTVAQEVELCNSSENGPLDTRRPHAFQTYYVSRLGYRFHIKT